MKHTFYSILLLCLYIWTVHADYVTEHNQIRWTVIDITKHSLARDWDLEQDAQKWADYLAENYTASDVGKSPHASSFQVWFHNLNSNSQWENIAWWSPTMTITRAINLWAWEKSDYSIENNTCSWVCGHYTQIVWQDTTHVWCAHSNSKHGYGQWVVCRYSPPWNYVWEFPYEAGYVPNKEVITPTSANFLAKKWFIQNQEWNEKLYNLWNAITRKEMMKIVMKVSWKNVVDTCIWDFWDVSNDWWCKYIESALKSWFIAKNESFRPNDTITKSEALKLIFKSRGKKKIQETDSWQEDYMESAYEYWYIGKRYNDYNTVATRGWIFDITANTYEK